MLERRTNVHGTKLEALKNEISSIQAKIKTMAPSTRGIPRQNSPVNALPEASKGKVKTLKEMAGNLLKNGNCNALNTQDESAKREIRDSKSPTKKLPNLRPRVQNGTARVQKIGPKSSESPKSSGRTALVVRSLKHTFGMDNRSRSQTPVESPTSTKTNGKVGQPILKVKQMTPHKILTRSRQRRQCGYTLKVRVLSSAAAARLRNPDGRSNGSNSPRRSTRISNPPAVLQYFGNMRSPLAADGLSNDNSDDYQPEQKKRRARAPKKQ